MAVTGEARFPGGDSFLRSYFEQAFEQELRNEGIKHSCGSPYRVKWLDNDGMIFRRAIASDSMEATLTVVCTVCVPRNHPTAYNYGRVSIGMEKTLHRFTGNVYDILKHEITGLWRDLKEHLRHHGFVLSTDDKAALAEAMTRVLKARGTALLSMFETALTIHEDQREIAREELLRFATNLGFVKERNWRVPVPQRLSVFEHSDPSVLPSFETRMDTLLALPADHPLAA